MSLPLCQCDISVIIGVGLVTHKTCILSGFRFQKAWSGEKYNKMDTVEGGGGAVEELVENTTVIAVNVTDDSMLRPGEPVTRQVFTSCCYPDFGCFKSPICNLKP